MKFTEDDVQNESRRNKEYADYKIARSMSFLLKREESKRLTSQRCLYCFYLQESRLCGQAFTKYECPICHKEEMRHNTAVPRVCVSCAKKHTLCIDCGADLYLRVRRSNAILVPESP